MFIELTDTAHHRTVLVVPVPTIMMVPLDSEDGNGSRHTGAVARTNDYGAQPDSRQVFILFYLQCESMRRDVRKGTCIKANYSYISPKSSSES
jgi:hypothetical protein